MLTSVASVFCLAVTSVPDWAVPNGIVTIAVPFSPAVTVTVGVVSGLLLLQVLFVFDKIIFAVPPACGV